MNSRSPDRKYFDFREIAIMDFAAHWHRTQVRKYTGEPYVNHLAAVAKTVKEYTGDSRIVVAAFCHDLYEDTSCPEQDLLHALSEAGFVEKEVRQINKMVWDLTDEYVKTNYPDLNRRRRKALEAKRLWTIRPDAQNVKYADLIDNMTDLMVNDKDFAQVYMREMNQILRGMDQGKPDLYKLALQTAKEAGEALKK